MNQNIIDNAIMHLNKFSEMNTIIKECEKPQFEKINDHFNPIVKSIIYQQISGKAAKSIYNRYIDLFDGKLPSSKIILNTNFDELKNIGLSKQKAQYIINVSNYFEEIGNNIDFKQLDDSAVYKELISIKGIGKWTIDMFLMFTLFRQDIFPTSDLGIQKGIKYIFNLKNLPTQEFMIQKAKPWQPYRTIACWYLWRIVDDEVVW